MEPLIQKNYVIELFLCIQKKKTLYLTRFLGQEQLLFLQLKTEGIELSSEYFNIASAEIQNSYTLLNTTTFQLYNGDCEEMIDRIEDGTVQLTLTSPPYADLIHKVVDDRENRHKKSAFVYENNATTKVYSDSKNDLGNMTMDAYKEKVVRIM